MNVDLKEAIDFIDLSDFSEGRFNVDVNLPDGRSVNLYGIVEFHGRTVQADYDSEPYFNGYAEVNLIDWTGYDREGNEIQVTDMTWFETKLANLLT